MTVPLCFYVMLGLLGTVTCGGVLELKMVSLTNEEGKTEAGKCCDHIAGFCLSDCDPYFDICLNDYTTAAVDSTNRKREWSDAGDSEQEKTCPLGRVITEALHNENSVEFGPYIEGLANPISFPFDYWGEGDLQLDIDIWDHDPKYDDLVEEISMYLMILPSPTAAEAEFVPLNYHGIANDLSVEVRVYCDPDFYTNNCSVYCRAQDDTGGHYECDPDGRRRCLPGWMGEWCTEDIDECQEEPCGDRGVCFNLINNFECVCHQGYDGQLCDIITDWCLATAPCQNGGSCYNYPDEEIPYSCVCAQGYTGRDCEEEFDACEGEPCRNGGICQPAGQFYQCHCASGWEGSTCEEMAYGAGKVTLEFLSFANADGHADDGNCCDRVFSVCSSECDTYFKICLDQPNGNPSTDECSIGAYTTEPTTNQDSFTFDDNYSIVFPFNRWNPNGMLLKVDAYDADANSDDEFIDYFLRQVVVSPSAGIGHGLVLEARTTLTVVVYVECDEGWGGPLCTDDITR